MRLRDDPRRLVPEAYAQLIELRATYADVDSAQHLNNVALARFFEEGRASMNVGLYGVDTVIRSSGGMQLLLAGVTIDYVSQGHYPGMVTLGTAVESLGRSSYQQCAALFQEGRCLALCTAVTVYAIDGRGAPLPDDIRDALEALKFRR